MSQRQMATMAIHGNTFEAFTIGFAALSFVFTVAATAGDYWLTLEGYGEEVGKIGLWQHCENIHQYKHSSENYSAGGSLVLAQVGMIAASVSLFLGLIISIVKKCSEFSQHGVISGILLFFLSSGAATNITALSVFTELTYELIDQFKEYHCGWSYISGWVAVALISACFVTSIASNYTRRTTVQVTNNMQVTVPNTFVSSVPYNQVIVSNSATSIS